MTADLIVYIIALVIVVLAFVQACREIFGKDEDKK